MMEATASRGAGKLAVSRARSAAVSPSAGCQYALQCGLMHVKPHAFRRFVGTELARRDLRQAQRALGAQAAGDYGVALRAR
jgi:hypothetical protein